MKLTLDNFGGVAPKYDSTILPHNLSQQALDIDLSGNNLRLLSCSADSNVPVIHTPVKLAVPKTPTISTSSLFDPLTTFVFQITNGVSTNTLNIISCTPNDYGYEFKCDGAYLTGHLNDLQLIIGINGETFTSDITVMFYSYYYGGGESQQWYNTTYGSKASIGVKQYSAEADFEYELHNVDGVTYALFGDCYFKDTFLGTSIPAPFFPPFLYVLDEQNILVRTTFSTTTSSYSSYRLTFEDAEGRQGPPSTETVLTSRQKTQANIVTFNGIDVIGTETPSYIHIFRADQGTEIEKYRHIGKVAYGTSSYTDYIAASNVLGYQLPIFRGVIPAVPLWGNRPENMTKVIRTPTMFYVGYLSKTLYFSGLRENSHMFPSDYFITLDYDIVDIQNLGSGVVVLTKQEVYTIFGQQPYEHWVQKVSDLGCDDNDSVAVIGDTLYYISENGIVAVRGNQSSLITESFFTVKQFRELNPTTMRLDTAQEKLFMFTETINYMFTFEGRISLVEISAENTTFSATQYTYKTKKFKFDQPVSFKIVRILANTYNNIVFYLYRNSVLISTLSITDDKPVRLSRLDEARYWELKVVSRDTINQIDIYQTEDEMLLKQ